MFKVYSSSAGSGKTYTLTKEYLKLALSSKSEGYYRHILAVTFTNAAANEMKDRILLMLRTFSEHTPEARLHPMMAEVITELFPETITDEELHGHAAQLLAQRAQAVFRQILHRYSDFAVMTIDKFTQRLISSFTDELGIPFVFETQLDSDTLDEAVDRLLARIGQEGEEVLTGIVERYYRENAEEGKSWGALPAQIRNTSETLLSERSYMQIKRVEDLQMEDWITIRTQMRGFVKEKEDKIKTLAETAFAAINSTFLSEKDFHQSGRGIYGYFRDRATGSKLWAEPNSYVNKTIGEGTWYGAKTAILIKDEIERLRPELENAFHQIENIRQTDSGKVLLYNQLTRHIYHLSLLAEIRKEFDAILKQNNQVHISDFNRKIIEIVAAEPIPFIFERLGERYNHILVDEFQDTSKLQFANLLPLIENALSAGHFNLVVGDAKQSIYRFRGGDMDLILRLAQSQVMQLASVLGEGTFHSERLLSVNNYLDLQHLKVNRRSFREITAFNNRFFSFLATTLTGEFPLIGEVYDQNFQQDIAPEAPAGGHVELEFVEMRADADEDGSEEQAADPIVQRTIALVAQLRAEGYNWRDLAILCRRKKEATTLANYLKEAGYPLISDDALSLGYSRSVHFLISFMKVLHSSDNRLARYEAAYLFHHVVKRTNPGPAEFEQIRVLCEEKGLDSFLNYFRRWNIELTAFKLRQLSVFELCEMLMERFGMLRGELESEYLFRLLDVVLEFGTRKSNHLGDFLTYWESARHKLSITIPEETDAIRITTIHRSKGLEYPVVLVPYAHWSVTPNAKLDRLWADLDDLEYEELYVPEQPNYRPKKLRSSMVSVVKDLQNTELASQYNEERIRTLVENLNLLYVAFTRPVQRLYVIARRERKWDSGQLVSHWLRDYLAQDDFIPAWDETVSVYTISSATATPRHAHLHTSAEPFVLKQILSNDRTDSLRLRRLADRIFDVKTFEPRYDRIQKLRYLLTRIRRKSDLRDALESMTLEGIFTKSEIDGMGASAENLLSKPELAALYNHNMPVQLNKELLVPGGKLMHIDRLLQTETGIVLMNFTRKDTLSEQRSAIKKLMKAYRTSGKRCRGALVDLEQEIVEWIDNV